MIRFYRFCIAMGLVLLTLAAVVAMALGFAAADPMDRYVVVPGRGVQTIPAPSWHGGGP